MDNINKDNFIGALRWKAVECDCVHVQPGSNGFSTLLAKRTERQRLLFCTYTTRPYATGMSNRIHILNIIGYKKKKWNAREIYTVFSFCKFQKVVLKNISMYTIFKFYYFEKNLFLNIESKKKKFFSIATLQKPDI